MGITISNILQRLFSKKELRILMVGLDGAGKTTILYKLKLGEVITTIPTIGFNVETVEYKNICFTVWDVGGQNKLRCLWKHYYANSSGIIFVIDSSDNERLEDAKRELDNLLDSEELRKAILLVFANKQDLPLAMTTQEVAEKLRLQNISDRRWRIQGACANLCQGIYEGLDWLSEELGK